MMTKKAQINELSLGIVITDDSISYKFPWIDLPLDNLIIPNILATIPDIKKTVIALDPNIMAGFPQLL